MKLNVIVNGVKMATINEGQSIEIPIPKRGATLQVSQTGLKSQQLDVQAGDYVEVTLRRWNLYLIIALIIFFLVGIFFRWFIFAVVGIISVIIISFMNFIVEGLHFKLRKVY